MTRQARVNPRLFARGAASQKPHHFRSKYIFAENLCQAHQSLLDGADALHGIGSLVEKLIQLVLCRADHLLHMSVDRRCRAGDSSCSAHTIPPLLRTVRSLWLAPLGRFAGLGRAMFRESVATLCGE